MDELFAQAKKIPTWAWIGAGIAAGAIVLYKQFFTAQAPASDGSTPDITPAPNTDTLTGENPCPTYRIPECALPNIVIFEADGNGCQMPVCSSIFHQPTQTDGNSGATYATVCSWTPVNTLWCSTIDGIAAHYGESEGTLLAFPENARYRANPNIVHLGDQVRVA